MAEFVRIGKFPNPHAEPKLVRTKGKWLVLEIFFRGLKMILYFIDNNLVVRQKPDGSLVISSVRPEEQNLVRQDYLFFFSPAF